MLETCEPPATGVERQVRSAARRQRARQLVQVGPAGDALVGDGVQPGQRGPRR